MSELLGKNFLQALSNASRSVANADSEAAATDAVAALQGAVEVLVVGSGEATLSIVEDTFY
ncbi:MAG: hypothetical protein IH941_14055, partial [Acidobacteria bacterium]|nr:hypothetical protein [Acidobacteriota bacterium]